MAAVPMPVRATVRDLLRDLLATDVVVRDGGEQTLSDERCSYLAVFRREDGAVVAAAVVDLVGAAALGGCLAEMTGGEVAAALDDADRLEGPLYESFAGSMGELGRVLDGPTTEPVTFDLVVPVPGEVPQAVASLVLEPAARADYAFAIDGHATGTLTLLSR